MYDLNYFFAIEKLDPEIARIEVTQVSTGDDKGTPIPMADC